MYIHTYIQWVQRVCGIQSPSDILDDSNLIPDNDFAAQNIIDLVSLVRERLKTQQCLARQIATLGEFLNIIVPFADLGSNTCTSISITKPDHLCVLVVVLKLFFLMKYI